MPFTLANVEGRAALVTDGNYFDLEAHSDGELGPDPMSAIAGHAGLHVLSSELDAADATGRLDDARLGPPVPNPKHCFGIGLNYRSHVAESAMEVPTAPVVFTKFPGCLAGPHDDVVLASDTADYEAELVVVIGNRCRNVTANDAWSHVAGVTAGQDISDRALQFAAKPPHFDLGKSRDTYGPMGPVLVSPDSVPSPDDLAISCTVNGEQRQQATTADLIFDVPHLVAYLSAIMTLQAGDVIFTGTPEGVGMATGNLLRDGDVITTAIEGIGTMENRCVA